MAEVTADNEERPVVVPVLGEHFINVLALGRLRAANKERDKLDIVAAVVSGATGATDARTYPAKM